VNQGRSAPREDTEHREEREPPTKKRRHARDFIPRMV
jgi:hypothetical protein